MKPVIFMLVLISQTLLVTSAPCSDEDGAASSSSFGSELHDYFDEDSSSASAAMSSSKDTQSTSNFGSRLKDFIDDYYDYYNYGDFSRRKQKTKANETVTTVHITNSTDGVTIKNVTRTSRAAPTYSQETDSSPTTLGSEKTNDNRGETQDILAHTETESELNSTDAPIPESDSHNSMSDVLGSDGPGHTNNSTGNRGSNSLETKDVTPITDGSDSTLSKSNTSDSVTSTSDDESKPIRSHTSGSNNFGSESTIEFASTVSASVDANNSTSENKKINNDRPDIRDKSGDPVALSPESSSADALTTASPESDTSISDVLGFNVSGCNNHSDNPRSSPLETTDQQVTPNTDESNSCTSNRKTSDSVTSTSDNDFKDIKPDDAGFGSTREFSSTVSANADSDNRTSSDTGSDDTGSLDSNIDDATIIIIETSDSFVVATA